MKTISLFSGCGGMDLGVERAGAHVVFANDVMPEAKETFGKYFPRTEFALGDISNVKVFPSADLVVGGYPCQSFSMGGNRRPEQDGRTLLFREFARCVNQVTPKFFVAENVSGLRALNEGRWLREQLDLFSDLGRSGYNIACQVLRAEEYGVPQRRKRIFLIGVRKDLGLHYWFPARTHAKGADGKKHGLAALASHGDAIAGLPLWPTGEFYERPHDPEGHFSWYYMSRNRKAPWDSPSFTVVANSRHTPMHPASSKMRMVWSNLADGFKQKWEFSGEFEHVSDHPERPILEEPRRLSWRECALIQTFPAEFEPVGNLSKKFEQIGNAVPPHLIEQLIRPLISGTGLKSFPQPSQVLERPSDTSQLELSLA